MNTLKSYISESLLDIDNVDSSDALTEEFLEENYKIDGSYTIKGGVVDIKGNIIVTNKADDMMYININHCLVLFLLRKQECVQCGVL